MKVSLLMLISTYLFNASYPGTFNTGRKLSQLEGRLAGNGCSLRNKFQPKEIGSVETLVLKVHGVQELCNELLPLKVRAVEG